MDIANLLKQIRHNGIDVKLSGEHLELIFHKENVDESVIEQVKENKQNILDYLKSITTTNQVAQIPLTVEKGIYDITSSQLRFWILCQMDEAINRAYNLPLILQLKGKLDTIILELAFNQLIDRHEILRSHFVERDDGTIGQKVLDLASFQFEMEKMNLNDDQIIHNAISEFIRKPFKLKDSPLFKVLLIEKNKNENYLCLNIHHIISDGSSLEIFVSDLMHIYNHILSEGAEGTTDLPKLNIQFKDYAEWVNERENNVEQEEKYWLEKLSGELPIINLPIYQQRPALKTYNGASYTYTLKRENLSKLKEFSNENKGTLFTLLMTALNGLLYRYTSQTDIILGIPVSKRNYSCLQNQIGLYINTLPIRMQFDPNISFLELFSLQKQELESTHSNSNYPFGELVNKLNLTRDVSRSPIFDILVTHQQKNNDSFNLESGLTNLKCSLYSNFENTVSKYDLTFTFCEEEHDLRLCIEYNTDLFQKNFIECLANNFENFVEQCLDNPKLMIGKISYLDSRQENQLLNTFNATEQEYNIQETIISSFQKQVLKTPEKIALVCEDNKISYRDIDEKSNQLALYLNALGVKPNTTVGICLGRSIEMVIGIIGILKSGASYLPLDPFYPLDRIDYIIDHSNTEFILTDNQTKNIIPKNATSINIEEREVWNSKTEGKLPELESSSLAYVIYTSGSTGKPKGVKVSHRNLTNFIEGMNQRFVKNTHDDVWLAMTSISFDISILELLWTLTRGDKIVIHLESPVVIQPKPEMDFSLFYFPTGSKSETDKYKLLLEGATYADKNEFKAIWVPERHFHNFGDQFPNPSVAAAAVSTITKNVKLRSGSVVLPLHDPVRVAEEWAMIDNLSGGRVELSIASGWHPNDFVLAPNDYQDRHQIMRDKIATLKSLWKGGSLIRKNGIGKDFEFNIHPKPIQGELPMWITAAGSIETFKYAGTIGASILTHLLGQNIEDLGEKIKTYRQTLQENGFDPKKGKVALMLHTFVSDDEEVVKKVIEKPFKNYLRNSLNLMKPIAEEQGLDLKDANDVETLLDMGFLRFYKTSSLFGTPESCLEIIDKVYDIGIDEIACLIDFGVEEQKVIDNLSHLSRLKELVRRSKVQYDFVVERLERLTTNEDTVTLINKHKVTHIQATPSFYEELLLNDQGIEALQQIKTLLIGGEALKKSLADKLIEVVGNPIYNMYGPTETTIWSSVKMIATSTEKEEVTIGTPIANTKIYILDTLNQLCPVGVSGELCIGGDGVSLGYLNNSELTASKFIKNPFVPEQKIYKTGDLARWVPNGELEYLGRFDRQIKIRGFRIELKEIENVLLEHKEVIQCVVSTIQQNEQVLLVAYIKTQSAVEEHVVKEFLRLRLPHYMIPQFVTVVDDFPYTPNGKIDIKKLPQPNGNQVKVKNYVAPRNELEEKLTTLWSDFLKIEKISIDDNFFEIGGNSIQAISIINRINKELKTSLQIKNLFSAPTIRGISELLDFLQYQDHKNSDHSKEVTLEEITI